MCFSAEASFGASAVLGAVGVVCLRKVIKQKPYLFAALPVFFALQQFSEGFVWLSLTDPDWAGFRKIPVYFFLIFALLVWPVWLPLSIWFIEIRPGIKKLLLAEVGFGLLFAVILGFFLFNHSVFPEIEGSHIHYELGFSGKLVQSASLLYFIPTIIPPFLSVWKRVWVLGLFLLVSYLVSKYYFDHAVVSVWCYLAAFISFIIWWSLSEMKHKDNPELKL